MNTDWKKVMAEEDKITMNTDWKRKLTSRKFWIAVTEFVAMLLLAFGKSEQQAQQITAIIMAGAGAIAYIIGEGLIDAAGAGKDEYTYIEGPEEDEVTTDVD